MANIFTLAGLFALTIINYFLIFVSLIKYVSDVNWRAFVWMSLSEYSDVICIK